MGTNQLRFYLQMFGLSFRSVFKHIPIFRHVLTGCPTFLNQSFLISTCQHFTDPEIL